MVEEEIIEEDEPVAKIVKSEPTIIKKNPEATVTSRKKLSGLVKVKKNEDKPKEESKKEKENNRKVETQNSQNSGLSLLCAYSDSENSE